jgi:hypothetical protein
VKGSVSDPAASPWGEHDLRGGDGLDFFIGALTLRFEEREGEVWLSRRASDERASAVQPGDARDSASEERPHGWTRWATAGWDGRVALTPGFPDRAVVVEPDGAFWLARGARARIYVRVPLWVHVEALGDERTSLTRIPTMTGSDTWWGSFEEGELCYWFATSARRTVEDSLFQPHLAMCPVQLENVSSDSLRVERIALRVAYLTLYAQGERIWADETTVRYQGEAEGAHLDVAGSPPPEAPGAQLLVPARLRMTRGVRAFTFARLRAVQGWI